jgi:hypothetical protein
MRSKTNVIPRIPPFCQAKRRTFPAKTIQDGFNKGCGLFHFEKNRQKQKTGDFSDPIFLTSALFEEMTHYKSNAKGLDRIMAGQNHQEKAAGASPHDSVPP